MATQIESNLSSNILFVVQAYLRLAISSHSDYTILRAHWAQGPHSHVIILGGSAPQPIFFEGSPFCHQKGRRKRWEFLNRCTFRFRSTPSSFFSTQQIGFGAAGHFCSIFEFLRHFVPFVSRFCFFGTPKILGKKTISIGQGLVGPWPYGPNDNPKGPTTTLYRAL